MAKLEERERRGNEYSEGSPAWLYKPESGEDELEKDFAAPPVRDEDLPPGHPSRSKTPSPGEIAQGETNAAQGPSAGKIPAAETGLADRIGGGFSKETGGKNIVRGFFTRKRLVGGGVAGLLIGATFGTFTIVSGPLQFIHIAQLLRQFHFSNQEDAGDDRMVKVGRYLRYKGDNRTRLNTLGNKYADKIEAKLNKSGVQSAYTERLNYFDGYIIDPANLPEGSRLGDLQNLSADEQVNAISERYKIPKNKIDLTIDSGKLAIHADDLGYFKSRRLMSQMMDDAGLSKISSWLRIRIMGKRAGITWHPMKKFDRKLLESIDARYAAWQKERQQRIDNGELVVTAAEETVDNDKDGKPDPPSQEAEQTKAQVDELLENAGAASDEIKTGNVTPDGPLAQLKTSTSLKMAGGATAAIGIICLAKGISDNIDDIKYANVALPLMRMGMEMVAVGNQVMSGQEVDTEQLGFYAKQLSDKETTWSDAKSFQAENGQAQSGPDIPSEARLGEGQNAVSQFIAGIPGVGGVCKATNSAVGQVVSFGIDILGGPISAITGAAVGALAGPALINGLTNWIAGHPIDIRVAGAAFGNFINYGARLAAGDSMVAAGGTELSPSESTLLKLHRLDVQRQEQSTKSFAKRMFDPYDANSLAGHIIDSQNPNVTANVASLSRSFTKPYTFFSAIPASFSTLFTNRAVAETADYDYGFPEYGFSVDEMNDSSVKNPFENADQVYNILNGPKGDGFIDKASKCFGINISKDGQTVQSQASTPPYNKIPNDCTDSDPDWLRVRFYIFDTQLMESQACYEGEGSSCLAIGFGSGQAQNYQ